MLCLLLKDPDLWAEVIQAWADDPSLLMEALEDMPARIPSARQSVETLERWILELTTNPSARTISPPNLDRRLS